MTDVLPDNNPKSVFGMTKPPLRLVPSTAVVNIAMVFKLGAQKYGPYNWREKAVSAGVYYEAADRHLRSWYDGELLDPESGQPHVAHAAACCMIILDAMNCGNLIDDRPTPAPTGKLIADLTAIEQKRAQAA